MSFFGWFGKDPKDLFLEFDPRPGTWRVVTWNFDLENQSERRMSIEIHGEQDKVIQWSKSMTSELRFFEKGRLVRKRRLPETDHEYKALMNLAMHSALKVALESHQGFMLTPVPGATTLDIQAETRALQWIQATFGTLSRALKTFEKNKELILTSAVFSGKEPETGDTVLRLIAFNLDIFFYLRDDQSLHIIVFDDKNFGQGQSKTPTFQQIIKVTKPQFYDEISKLVHQIAKVGEIE